MSKDNVNQQVTTVLLTSTANNFEAESLMALLSTENIEVIKKFSGTGSYLNIIHGTNYQGVDLYVREEDLSHAKSLMMDSVDEALLEELVNESEEVPHEDLEAHSKSRRNFARRLMIFFYVMPIVVVALLILWERFQ